VGRNSAELSSATSAFLIQAFIYFDKSERLDNKLIKLFFKSFILKADTRNHPLLRESSQEAPDPPENYAYSYQPNNISDETGATWILAPTNPSLH